jgi:hypothetical protein
MDYHAVLLMSGVLAAGFAASLVACSGPDPGAITFSERPSSGPSEPQSSGTSSSGGTPAQPDAGIGTGNLIFGTSLMAWVDPGLVANTASPNHPNQKVEGVDCVTAGCHLDKGPQWLFAGTVYSTAQGGATVAKAEIRIVDPAGTEVGHTYTDANGNFWLEKAGTIPANSRVGVRKEGGTAPMIMSGSLQPTDRGCNANRANCHGTPAQGKVFIQ